MIARFRDFLVVWKRCCEISLDEHPNGFRGAKVDFSNGGEMIPTNALGSY